jgi:hypothetical protein
MIFVERKQKPAWLLAVVLGLASSSICFGQARQEESVDVLIFQYAPGQEPMSIRDDENRPTAELLSAEETQSLGRMLPTGVVRLVNVTRLGEEETATRRAILVFRRAPSSEQGRILLPYPSLRETTTVYVQEARSDWWSTVPNVTRLSQQLVITRSDDDSSKLVVRLEAVP